MRIRLLPPVVAAALLAGAATAASAEPLRVVATFSILADIAAKIAGDRAEVTALVGPNGDAHVYQPGPGDARTIRSADLVVVNGLGFEGFMDRLMEASGYTGPIVVASSAIVPLEAGTDDHGHDDPGHAADDHDDHDHEDEVAGHDAAEDPHDHGPMDPHAWQDLANGMAYATAVADGLCGVDPDGCTSYRANAEAYRADLAGLDTDIRARIDAIPAERRIVVTSHDAFGYFGAAYGVRFIAPQGVSTDAEASARDVASLIEQIRDTGVRTVFTESIADPRLIEQIARETGATVGTDLKSDALAPHGEPGDSYLSMMRHNADALIAAMQPGS